MVWHLQFTSESPEHEKAELAGYLGLANPAGHRHQGSVVMVPGTEICPLCLGFRGPNEKKLGFGIALHRISSLLEHMADCIKLFPDRL